MKMKVKAPYEAPEAEIVVVKIERAFVESPKEDISGGEEDEYGPF